MSDFKNRAIQEVKDMWRVYVVDRMPEEIIASFDNMPDSISVIGTGQHEFYKNKEEYINALINSSQIGGEEIQFMILDDWYEAVEVSQDVCVVYGCVWFREVPIPGKPILVDMVNSRFSVVCKNVNDKVVIYNVHHSMPFIEQTDNEYYPSKLTNIANEATRKNQALERKIQLDPMTELYNRIFMERHVSKELKENDGYFFLIDLDDFKNINDTKGHLAGDQVIIDFASIINQVFPQDSIVGRMGGDEFAVWVSHNLSQREIDEVHNTILKGCHDLTEDLGMPVKCSIGVAFSSKDTESFMDIYKRSDLALYAAKYQGKGKLVYSNKDTKIGRRKTD